MDHKFTEQIKQWLETPESERDYAVGALYLLKLSGNQIMYKNIRLTAATMSWTISFKSITTSAFKP